MTKDIIKQIIKNYRSGELNNNNDESGAEGFWDLSGEIIREHVDYDTMPIIDDLQDEIYQTLKEMYYLIK